EVSKPQQETPVVTKPPVALVPPEKPHDVPTFSHGTSGVTDIGTTDKPAVTGKPTTEQPKSRGLPSNGQTQAEKPAALSESAAAARAATQKSQQAKTAEPQTAQGAQTEGAPTTDAEESKTTTGQAQETAKADRRKSGGFWGWVKRKVKGA
ncbi:hypothetical protein COL922a_014382, partial [Colletotrichum nupharicola]